MNYNPFFSKSPKKFITHQYNQKEIIIFALINDFNNRCYGIILFELVLLLLGFQLNSWLKESIKINKKDKKCLFNSFELFKNFHSNVANESLTQIIDTA